MKSASKVAGLDLNPEEEIVMLQRLDGPVSKINCGGKIAEQLLARLNECHLTSIDQSFVNYDMKVNLCPSLLLARQKWLLTRETPVLTGWQYTL